MKPPGPQHTAPLTLAINVARVAFACAAVGSCAVGLAPRAFASPCDPTTLAMTPQPQLSCPAPEAAAPADGVPVAAPPPVPGSDVTGPPLPDAFPPPGEPPHIPPVVGEDGAPTTSYGQGGYFGQIWSEFHNGVPSDVIYGPAPGAPAPPPPSP
ncbi:MAG TPA: hypothetical protein VI029_11580 [Mycobacterium sp.]